MVATGIRIVMSFLAAGIWVCAQTPVPENGFKAIDEAFRTHSIVAVAEVHRAQNTADFVLGLLRHPALPPEVRYLAIEFGSSLYQSVLDRYVAGEEVPHSELQKVWRETTVVNGLWDAPVYEQFLAGVRERNRQLPPSRRIRVLACDPPIEWSRVQTLADAASFLARDTFWAELLDREVLRKEQKAIVFAGGAHVNRRTVTGTPAKNVVTMLDQSHPGAVWTVQVYDGEIKDAASLESHLTSWPVPSIATLKNTWLGEIKAEFPRPPVRTRVGPGVNTAESVVITTAPSLEEETDALLYLGPRSSWRRSIPELDSFDTSYLRELDRRNQLLFGRPLDAKELTR